MYFYSIWTDQTFLSLLINSAGLLLTHSLVYLISVLSSEQIDSGPDLGGIQGAMAPGPHQ